MRLSIGWTLPALVLGAGCARGPVPCTTPGTCSGGEECLANRCVAAGHDPVPAAARRWVITADRVAVVNHAGTSATGRLPSAVRFGSAAEGAAVLYLRFAPVWASAARVDSAFLLLEPLPETPASTADVLVRALRVEESWDARTLSFLHQPKLGLPSSRAWARSRPPSMLRIDVTNIIRYQHEHTIAALGIAVKASGGGGHGAAFATGSALGSPPRLELYVR
jgi:hypothetical protein